MSAESSTAVIPESPPRWKIDLWNSLRSIRPIMLGSILKRLLGVRRFHYKLPGGEVFWIDPVSNLGLFLLRQNKYEETMTELIRKILQPGDTFIDIGANEGYFTIMASKAVGETGRVLAVEPQSRLAPVLRENIRVNNVESIASIHGIGLAEKETDEHLFLAPDVNSGASSFRRYWRFGFGREEIRVRTLGHFFTANRIERARLAKIDCEGAEIRIIAGAAPMLQDNPIDYLIIEYHPWIVGEEACRRTQELMLRVGYRLLRVNGHYVYYAERLFQEAQELKALRRNPSEPDEEFDAG